VKKNSDVSYDIYFGPKPSEDKLEYRDAAEALRRDRRDPEQRFLAMRLYNPKTEARTLDWVTPKLALGLAYQYRDEMCSFCADLRHGIREEMNS
jgi:hypothetical protein